MASSNASRVSDAHKSKVQNLNAASEPAAKKAQKDKNRKVLDTASQLKSEDQTKRFAELKQSQIELIDGLANAVTSELSTLHVLVDATKLAKDELDQVHQITAEANSLSALILAQEDQRKSFQEEISAIRAGWDIEQREREVARKREDDTFRYNLGVTRRKEADDYENEKQARNRQFDAELAERNAVVVEGEKQVQASLAEIIELRDKVATSDARHDAEVKKQVAIATSSLKKDLEHQFALERLKYENQAALAKQQIQALNTKVSDQSAAIERLTEKNLEATQRIQQIAERAVDAARPTFFNAPVSNGHDSGSKRAS